MENSILKELEARDFSRVSVHEQYRLEKTGCCIQRPVFTLLS